MAHVLILSLFQSTPGILAQNHQIVLLAIRNIIRGLALSIIVLALPACSTIPATGQSAFTAFSSIEDDQALGQREHNNIVRQFGGSYDKKAMQNYVASVGKLLVQTSELPNTDFTFTVLDSPIVNAFALPGGYVYVTRGLLALVDNEAELAAVLAHEIGHVTARHTARRIGQATLLQTVITGLGGGQLTRHLGTLGATLYLLKNSRDHEYEADSLSVRYLQRAGFEPQAMASFLGKMAEDQALQRLVNKQVKPEPLALFSTHPASPERISHLQKKLGKNRQQNRIIAPGIYLDKINGMIVGVDVQSEGYIDGDKFIHPDLDMVLRFPAPYSLVNNPSHLLASGKNNNRILVDIVPWDNAKMHTAQDYMRNHWSGLDIGRVITTRINSQDLTLAQTQVKLKNGAVVPTWVSAVRWNNDYILRLIALNSNSKAGLDTLLFVLNTLRSTRSDERQIGQDIISIVTVKPGQTMHDLATMMEVSDYPMERFIVLNGLARDQILSPNQRVKIIINAMKTSRPSKQ